MSSKNMVLTFASRLDDVKELNSSFDTGVLRVAYVGANRNNSFISKEVFERCMPTIYNCPIVCNYDRDADSIGSHDMAVVKGEDGVRIVAMTQPVGVVPESANYYWEEVDDGGEIHEYLCVDVLIWKRQEAYKKIKEDVVTDESMEISIKDGKMIDGLYVINDFEFLAFCLLGSAEPCYESASLTMFSHAGIKEQIATMMSDLRETFALDHPLQEDDINLQNNLEGGECVLGCKDELEPVVETCVEANSLNAEADELQNGVAESDRDSGNSDQLQTRVDTCSLESQFAQELAKTVESEKVETRYGIASKYQMCDYDKDISEVYAWDSSDWNIYGFKYSTDGDRVIVHFETKKRMKYSIVPFEDGSRCTSISDLVSIIADGYEAVVASSAEKLSSAEAELAELREFKAAAEASAENDKRNSVLSQFEDLIGNEEFEAIKGDAASYSAEDLEEKCFAIRGRVVSRAQFSIKDAPAPKLRVEKHDKNGSEEDPYGGIFEEYNITSD